MEYLYLILIAWILIVSIITYFYYASDKKRAIKQQRRIPEATLLTLSIVGGAIGGYIAMQTKRHKTAREHWYFSFVNIVGIVLHITAVVLLAIFL